VDRTKLYRSAQPFISKLYLPLPLQKSTCVDQTKAGKLVSHIYRYTCLRKGQILCVIMCINFCFMIVNGRNLYFIRLCFWLHHITYGTLLLAPSWRNHHEVSGGMTRLEASLRQLAWGWIQHDAVRPFICSLRGQVSVITHSVRSNMAPWTHVKHYALHL
jgi:hypothetical protein